MSRIYADLRLQQVEETARGAGKSWARYCSVNERAPT